MGYAGSDPRKWVYHTQTEKKHHILKAYLQAWYPILASSQDRLLVVDGFAGRGRYTPIDGITAIGDAEVEGSPLIMLKSLIEHTHFGDKKYDLAKVKEVVFLFVEADPENHKLLSDALENYKTTLPEWPKNVKTRVSHCRFENTAENGIDEYILERSEDDTLRQATFLFIDPFGFTGIPMKLVSRLCQYRPRHNVELLFNFMSDYIIRAAGETSQESNMTKLFGVNSTEWRSFRNGKFAEDSTVQVLVDYFVSQLKERAAFKYIKPIEMKRQDGTHIYNLLHASQHFKGVTTMKDVMWRVDEAAAKDLCSRSKPIEVLLQEYLKDKPPNAEVEVEDIGDFVVAETPFRRSDGTRALKEFENDGSISVVQGGRRGRGYLQGSAIIFNGVQATKPDSTVESPGRKKPDRTSTTGSPSKMQPPITKFFFRQ